MVAQAFNARRGSSCSSNYAVVVQYRLRCCAIFFETIARQKHVMHHAFSSAALFGLLRAFPAISPVTASSLFSATLYTFVLVLRAVMI